MAGTFDTEYGITPWAQLDQNEHTIYVPELLENYVKRSMFYGMVDYAVNLLAQRTKTLVFTQLVEPEANIATLDVRALWLPSLYVDSQSIEIVTERYGDKIMLHKYDDYITAWKKSGTPGLRNIMDSLLGPHMVESLDILARNAFLEAHFKSFAGAKTSFGTILASNTFEEGIARAVQLRSDYSDLDESPIFCVTSPSALYQLKSQALGSGEWIDRQKYANPSILVNYEMGSYEGVRFVRSPLMTLWNCGEVLKQAVITESVTEGDGAPDPQTTKVDGVWRVGQHGATHGIAYTNTWGTLAVGDMVTFHRTRNVSETATAVQYGVPWNTPYQCTRRVVAISGGRVFLNKPILVDYFKTETSGSSGIYGYITVGRPIHAAIFIKGPRGVVCGVTQPPQTYTPIAIDDTEAIHRFSWDAYIKYQPFFTDRFEVYFFAGPVPIENSVVTL
jgi:hypothetical protein